MHGHCADDVDRRDFAGDARRAVPPMGAGCVSVRNGRTFARRTGRLVGGAVDACECKGEARCCDQLLLHCPAPWQRCTYSLLSGARVGTHTGHMRWLEAAVLIRVQEMNMIR